MEKLYLHWREHWGDLKIIIHTQRSDKNMPSAEKNMSSIPVVCYKNQYTLSVSFSPSPTLSHFNGHHMHRYHASTANEICTGEVCHH